MFVTATSVTHLMSTSSYLTFLQLSAYSCQNWLNDLNLPFKMLQPDSALKHSNLIHLQVCNPGKCEVDEQYNCLKTI